MPAEVNEQSVRDKKLQYIIGNLLRWGVWSAISVAGIGGILYLRAHGHETVSYPKFQEQDRSLSSIISDTFHDLASGNYQSIIMLGTLLLFATPILRVILSLISFVIEKDKLYILITLIVLGIILLSVNGGLG